MGILEAQRITVRVGHKEILRSADACIAAGKRTAIIGPNGSGKSTLLKALSGLIPCAEGAVRFDGTDLRKIGRKALARRLAILPQGAGVPADMTVGELVAYGRFPHRAWYRSSTEEDTKCVDWALTCTQMTDYRDRLIATLSGGERQRAWIAMALAQQPELLLLDEPTTYLDIAHQLEVMEIVSSLNRRNGLSVVMVLHDINHTLQYADAVIVVKDGTIFASGAPQDVIRVEMLEQVFGVTAERFVDKRGRSVFLPGRLTEVD